MLVRLVASTDLAGWRAVLQFTLANDVTLVKAWGGGKWSAEASGNSLAVYIISLSAEELIRAGSHVDIGVEYLWPLPTADLCPQLASAVLEAASTTTTTTTTDLAERHKTYVVFPAASFDTLIGDADSEAAETFVSKLLKLMQFAGINVDAVVATGIYPGSVVVELEFADYVSASTANEKVGSVHFCVPVGPYPASVCSDPAASSSMTQAGTHSSTTPSPSQDNDDEEGIQHRLGFIPVFTVVLGAMVCLAAFLAWTRYSKNKRGPDGDGMSDELEWDP